jgi:hypothetical protein
MLAMHYIEEVFVLLAMSTQITRSSREAGTHSDTLPVRLVVYNETHSSHKQIFKAHTFYDTDDLN